MISAWIAYGTSDERDYHYVRFMSLWVAFNALCYAKYSLVANRRRADLAKDTGLKNASAAPTPITGTMVAVSNGRVKLDVRQPGPIVVTIAERYSEDIIFSKFAKDYKEYYVKWLLDERFRASVLAFQQAISTRGKPYVVNMARIDDYSSSGDLEDLERRNIIVSFGHLDNLQQLKDVLYQVRCNVFHGEKVPGDPNDDRIVQAAHPVLLHIVRQLTPSTLPL